MQRRTPGNVGRFPGMDRVLFHIQVRTLYAKDIFKEKSKMFAVFRAPATEPPVEPRSTGRKLGGGLVVGVRGLGEARGAGARGMGSDVRNGEEGTWIGE